MEISKDERRTEQINKTRNHKVLTSPPPLVLKAGHYLLTLILMGLAVHLILPQLASVESSFNVIKTMVLWAVLLAALAQTISYLGTGYLIHSVVSIVDQHISVIRGVMIALAASSIGMLAGGTLGNAAATYKWVRKYGVNAEGSGLAGTLPTIFINATLMVLSISGVVHLLLAHKLSSVQFFIFLLILALLLLGLLAVSWGKGHREGFKRLIVRIGAYFSRILHIPYDPLPAENFASRMFSSLEMLGNGGWQRPALGAIISTGFDMLTLYFFFVAAGYPVGPEILLVGYGLPLLLGKMAFVLPGGVGIVESTMTALYTGLGVPGSIAVVVVLSYRVFSFWIPTITGFPIAFYLQKE